MRIAIVSPFITSSTDKSFYASQHLYIASGLTKLGAEVEIFTMDRTGKGAWSEIIQADGGSFTIHYLPQVSKLLTRLNLAMMIGLCSLLRKGRFDIIQVSEDTQLTSVQVSLMNIKAQLTIFQGINNYSRNPFKASLMKLFDCLAGRYLKKRVALVIAKTNEAADFMSRKGYRNVMTIPMGVDTELFSPQDKKQARMLIRERDVIATGFLALYVGNLIRRRDVSVIIKGISIVREKGKNVELLVVGDGPEKKSLMLLAEKLGIGNAVHFLDRVPNKQMPLIYSAADVFLFVPLYEIFGMVLLEAMACGLPVIATPVPAVNDILASSSEQAILKVSFSSSQEIAQTLEFLVKDLEETRALGCRALELSAGFSWNSITRRIYNAYSELI